MNLRHVVPALGLVALSATAASAQEIATGVFLNGWSDNILTWVHSPAATAGSGSLGAENYDSLDFSSAAKLRVDWNVNSQISGRIGVRFNDVGGGLTNVGTSNAGGTQNGAYLQESFVTVQASPSTAVTAGKFIDPFGWQSAEPTGLNRINYGLTIGYYGNDVLGASVSHTTQTSEKGTLVSTFQVTNGYFTGIDGINAGSVNSNAAGLNEHRRNDMGLGADFSFTPNGDKTNLNLEFGWDPSSSTNQAPGGFNGHIFQVGLNGTLQANDKLMLGGEVIYRNSQAQIVTDTGKIDSEQDLAYLLTGTQTLDTTEKLCPMAVTLMFSANNQDFTGDSATSKPVTDQLALALLTNPYGSSNFGLNIEYQYQWVEAGGELGASSQIALEGLVVIP